MWQTTGLETSWKLFAFFIQHLWLSFSAYIGSPRCFKTTLKNYSYQNNQNNVLRIMRSQCYLYTLYCVGCFLHIITFNSFSNLMIFSLWYYFPYYKRKCGLGGLVSCSRSYIQEIVEPGFDSRSDPRNQDFSLLYSTDVSATVWAPLAGRQKFYKCPIK